MISSWKRRTSRLALLAAAAAAAAVFFVHPAAAAVEPEAFLGGKHWRYDTSTNGPVHVWTPGGYDPATAITVIHVHGDAETRTGSNCDPAGVPYVTPYTSGKYADAAWVKMKLAEQWSASGLNAFFIFPDGPIGQTERQAHTRAWKSLNGLLTSVETNTGQQIPQRIVVSGHSGAYETMHHWTGNSRITGFVLLDSTYDGASNWYGWYNGGADRRLAVIHTGGLGVSKTGIQAKKIAGETSAKILDSAPATAGELFAQTGDKRAVVMKSQYCHADIIRLGKVIPVLLPWAASTAAAQASGGTPAATPPAVSAPGAGQPTTLPDAGIEAPLLEIPIPGLELSDAVRESGIVTIPWLAQYIAGAYAFLLSIVGLVAAVMMIVGGFQYLTSGGDAGRIGAGRKRITDALIGLVLAFGSYTILYAINPGLVSFEGLRIRATQTELFSNDDINAENEGGLIAASEESSGVTPGSGEFPDLGSEGRPQPVCNREGTGGLPPCSDFCKMPLDATAVDDESGKKYQISSKWPTTTRGMADPKNIVKISGLTGVKSSKSTDTKTLELLKKAGQIASSTSELEKIGVSGGPYVIHVTSGYRPLFVQLAKACDSDGGKGTNIGSTLANPGGSLHGAGFALDILLERPGGGAASHCSGCSHAQHLPEYRKGSINLAKIMFAAGFRRVNNEIWHFEPANAPKPSCRCASLETCTFPSRTSSTWLTAYKKVNDALSADPKNSALKAAWSKITDVKYSGGTVDVKGEKVSVPASPIGCGKTSNYEDGAL